MDIVPTPVKLTADRARQLRDERRAAEKACIEKASAKIEKYATNGRSSCVIIFKKCKWKAQKCFDYFTEQGFECEWTHTDGFRCKW